MDTLKVGDRVRRKFAYQKSNWRHGNDTLTIKHIDREGYLCQLEGITDSSEFILNYFEKAEDKPAVSDSVNHPPHYAGQIEAIDYILQVAATYPGNEAALVANVIKYVSRATRKGDKAKDLKKAQWYLNKLVEISS
jgi:hypothetical protein